MLGYILLLKKILLEEAIILDTDWFYRRFGTIFLRFCERGLDRTGRRIQEKLSDMVASLIILSKDPLYDPEITISRIQSRMLEIIGHSSRTLSLPNNPMSDRHFNRLLEKGRAYDENFYRKSVGLGVLLVVIIFFVFSWFFIKAV